MSDPDAMRDLARACVEADENWGGQDPVIRALAEKARFLLVVDEGLNGGAS